MFRIYKRNHRQHDREHAKPIDVKNLSLYRWVKHKSISMDFFSGVGKHKGEEEN